MDIKGHWNLLKSQRFRYLLYSTPPAPLASVGFGVGLWHIDQGYALWMLPFWVVIDLIIKYDIAARYDKAAARRVNLLPR